MPRQRRAANSWSSKQAVGLGADRKYVGAGLKPAPTSLSICAKRRRRRAAQFVLQPGLRGACLVLCLIDRSALAKEAFIMRAIPIAAIRFAALLLSSIGANAGTWWDQLRLLFVRTMPGRAFRQRRVMLSELPNAAALSARLSFRFLAHKSSRSRCGARVGWVERSETRQRRVGSREELDPTYNCGTSQSLHSAPCWSRCRHFPR